MADSENEEIDTNGVSLELATTRQIMAELRRRGDAFVLALAVPGDEQPAQPATGESFLVRATVHYHGCKAKVRLLASMLIGEMQRRGMFGEKGE